MNQTETRNAKIHQLGFYPCPKVPGRTTNNVSSGYRYGCDICAESVVIQDTDEGGVTAISSIIKEMGKKYCPHEVCPYKDEIEAHSKKNYDQYDRYQRLKKKVLWDFKF